MQKKRRKYGDAWKDIEIDAASNDAVFDKFLKQPVAPPMAQPQVTGEPLPIIPRTESVPRSESVRGTENRNTPVQNVPGTESTPRTDSVPRKGHLRLSNEFLYDIMPHLKPSDGYVLLYLVARTHGFRQGSTTVTLDSIAKACSISRSQARVNINSLVVKGYIRHLGTDSSNRNPLLRGMLIEVLQPTAAHTDSVPRVDSGRGTESTPIKHKELKNTHNTEAGVRVSSRFSLAECRRYAESLRADGITNPGGYATKIHRSGEADELISKFLKPVESAKAVDVSGCPDCHGTGFYEPGGAGKGVARCKHERIREAG